MINNLSKNLNWLRYICFGFVSGSSIAVLFIVGAAVWSAFSAEGVKPSDLSSIGGGVLGAILGGFATYAASYVLGQHQRKELQKSAVLKCYLKVSQISSDIDNSLAHIQQSIKRADAAGHAKMPIWAKVSLQAGDSRPIEITPDDTLPFAELGEFELFGRIMTSGMQHEASCASDNMYARLRLELRSVLPITQIDDTLVTSDTHKLTPEARLRMKELETLLQSHLNLGPKFSIETAQVANLIADLLWQKYKVRVAKFVIPETKQ